jgi:hypothetical protein
MAANKGDRIHAALMGLDALGLVAFWIGFFTSKKARSSDAPISPELQKVFLLSDAYTVSALLLASRRLSQGKPDAVGLGIAGTSAVTYLSGLNTLFALRQRRQAGSTGNSAAQMAPYVAVMLAGPVSMLRLWRARHRLEN